MAEWLNTVFYSFDNAIINGIASCANDFLTSIFVALSVLFDKGILIILTALVLALFKKTRKLGAAIILAVLIGAIFTNVALKNLVMRERPYTIPEYRDLWQLVGSQNEGEFSFPSGHATSVMAASTALFIVCNKKWSFVGFIFTIIMAIDRVYLVVHYPTDVIAGIIVGGIAGLIACWGVDAIFKWAENSKCKFITWCLSFDVLNLFKKGEENK